MTSAEKWQLFFEKLNEATVQNYDEDSRQDLEFVGLPLKYIKMIQDDAYKAGLQKCLGAAKLLKAPNVTIAIKKLISLAEEKDQ